VKTILLVAVAAALLDARPAFAQPAPTLPRFDAAASVGWLGVRGDRPSRYSRGWADSLFGSASAGWYWTDHLKTEIDAGAGTKARMHVSQPIQIDGRASWHHVEVESSRRTAGIGQLYQYGRNAWFHSYIGAGVHLTWDRRIERHHPVIVYSPSTPPQTVRDAYTEGPATRFTARPFVSTGFKTYLTQRAFLRSDLRVGFRRGLDEAIVRAGFGFDF
jgi:hypothetical protein